jgi:hypothetical protein
MRVVTPSARAEPVPGVATLLTRSEHPCAS